MKIALIAHDKKKNEIIELSKEYKDVLSQHELYATGTTGTLIMGETGLTIHRMKSGPLGGDQSPLYSFCRSASLSAGIICSYKFYPFIPRYYIFHYIKKFFSFGFLLMATVLVIAECHLANFYRSCAFFLYIA